MIIYRALIRESARNTLALAFVLTVIMGFVGLSVWLGRAVQGDIGQNVVFQLLGLEALRRLDLLLTLSFYLGVLFTLARWYRDNEMTVLAACGVGLAQLLRPILVLSAIVMVTIAFLSCAVNPWAAGLMEVLKVTGQRHTELADTASGVFNDLGQGTRIYYAEKVNNETGVSKNVFVSGPRGDRAGTVIARRASPWTDPKNGDRYILLENGSTYDGNPGKADYQVMHFERLYLWVKPPLAIRASSRVETLGIGKLSGQRDRAAVAEFNWRIAKPFTALVLVLFAFTLAYTDPRRGRMSSLFSAILVYFIYSNMLAYGDTLLKRGRIPGMVGLWWVHLIMAVVAVYFFYRRANNRPMFGSWRRAVRAS